MCQLWEELTGSMYSCIPMVIPGDVRLESMGLSTVGGADR